MKELALQVARARVNKGLTFTELSNKCGLVNDLLWEIENGDMRRISISELVKVAKALDMVLDVKFVKYRTEDDGGEAMTAQYPSGKTRDSRTHEGAE